MEKIKIALTSDVHSDTGILIHDDSEFDADLYVFAGDMGDPYKIRKKIINGTYNSRTNVPIAYIPGNHEYYKYDFDTINSEIFNGTDSCYNRHSIVVKGRNIHLATLWTDLSSDLDKLIYEQYLNDPKWILNWGSIRAQNEFIKTIAWLDKVIKPGDIVITHHSPSFLGTHDRWKDSVMNSCFHTALDRFILEKFPALWCHGHIHDPMDYMIGGTRVVANPFGYRHEHAALRELHGPYVPQVIEV